ncbi:ankyrin repeat-containing protein ITN1 [Eucalyptus grandis]|uniref:ankyrin repeat-containing protein ITN1 n=1 Tax=Eucalyptus grandis TaxID=71139 RepID=UPI00192EFD2C|nr:ankyrin repeat-containing protein ITN1 [Eucalyptus grandis]
MATQPSEEQGNSNHAEPAADIENVLASLGSASSQSGGASARIKVLTEGSEKFASIAKNSEEEVDEPYYRPLLRAAFRGDWESATRFFERDAASKMAKITRRSETLLHIAALSAHDQFLENLVELLSPNPVALEMVDCGGRTALHNAVLCGRIRMVKALVRSNPTLTQLADEEGRVPLGISALEASMHKEIAWFLAKSTTDDGPSQPFSSPSAIDFILELTDSGHLGIPVNLSYKPTDKNSDTVPIIKRVHEKKRVHVEAVELGKQVCMAISCMSTTEITEFFQDGNLLYQATLRGISEIVKLCIQFFPELIRIRPFGNSLPSHAMQFRQPRTLGLFLKLSSTAELSLVLRPTFNDSEGMMKSVVSYGFDSDVTGAAFEMQRELQWFKAVESWIIPSVRSYYYFEENNKGIGKTFWKAFVENHKELLEKGGKWVKDTANSCMLVSTLIATILFAAAFTVPGGNDNNTGVPLLLGQDSLLIFAISDALGLFSSVTAILLFLAILTSRYEAQDFLYSLPKKILMGLCFLFLSLAFMLVTFAATLTMVLHKRLEWILIPIILLASIPVALFIILQLPLLFQMVQSTYGSSIFRPEGIWDGVNYIEQDQ